MNESLYGFKVFQIRDIHADPGDLIDGDMRGRVPASTYHVGRDVRGVRYRSQMERDSGVIKVSDEGSEGKKQTCTDVDIPGAVPSPPAAAARPDWRTGCECSTPFSH